MNLIHQLTLGSLASILEGRLYHDSLPPLDGDRQLISSLVRSSGGSPRGGEVVWLEGAAADWYLAHEQYRQGALGMISQHRLCPWAGRSAIQVARPEIAAANLIRWCRARQRGGVQLVIRCDLPASCAQHVRYVAQRRQGTWLQPQSMIELATDWANLSGEAEGGLWIEINPWTNPDSSQISLLCDPEILVITCLAVGERQAALMQSDSVVTCCHTACRTAAGRLPVVLEMNDADHFAQNLAVATHTIFPSEPTANRLGVSGWLAIANSPRAASVNDKQMEVPSFAAGLREPNATLPPGLKRIAG